MGALFVTGTGTAIGKTLVTAALCHELRARGRPVRALKPVLSGYDPADRHESDPGILLASLGEAVTEEAVAAITPWRFSAPLSPDMAAAREGRRLDLARHRRLLPRGGGRPAADRGHRRRHGAPRRAPHGARLDGGARRARAGGGGQLPRHHQPHADNARGPARARRACRRAGHQRIRGKPGAARRDRRDHRPPRRPAAHRPPAAPREIFPPARRLGARPRRSPRRSACSTPERSSSPQRKRLAAGKPRGAGRPAWPRFPCHCSSAVSVRTPAPARQRSPWPESKTCASLSVASG